MPVDIIIPKLGGNIDTVTISEWQKNEFEPVKKGEVLLTVEAEKVVLEIEAEQSGSLMQILRQKGEKVPVGTVVGKIALENESTSAASLGVTKEKEATTYSNPSLSVVSGISLETKKVLVIGGGSGGYMAALKAAQNGAKVTLITKGPLGGTCLHSGCMPTKAYLSRARLFDQLKFYEEVLGKEAISLDMNVLSKKTTESIRLLESGIKNILSSQNVEVLFGTASFISPSEVLFKTDDNQTEAIPFDACIVATGSRPNAIPGIAVDGERIHNTDTIWNYKQLPNRVLIVGSGAVGLEFASFYNALGSKVHIIEMLPNPAPHMDREIAGSLIACFNKSGVVVDVKKRLSAVENTKQELIAYVDGDEGSEEIACDLLLLATGRSPVTDGLDLHKIGMALNGRAIAVDGTMATNLPGIYAVGDCVGGIMLAHAAFLEADIAVQNIMGSRCEIDYNLVPFCTYSFPEVASIGLSESKARENYPDLLVGHLPLYANGKAQVSGESEGVVKVLADANTGEILGAHILAYHATELIGEFSLAVSSEVTIEEFAKVVKGHPTISEALTEAALDAFGMAPHVPKKMIV
jgi:dihydrolipoamide dehydrogenase